MKKINVGVYPFDDFFIPNLKYENLFDDIRFTALLNHNGVLLKGNDIIEASDLAKESLAVDWQRFDGLDKQIDMLLVTERIENMDLNHVLSLIGRYCQAGTGVILAEVRADIKEQISRLCREHGARYAAVRNWDGKKNMISWTDIEYSFNYQKVETPTVAVSGVSPFTQGLDIQLELMSSFLKDGYRVSMVGTGPLSELAGAYPISGILSDSKLPEVHKVYFLNALLKKIEEQETPDVIIVGIDDPILPLSRKHCFNFGIHAVEAFSAFTPDVSVATFINGEYNDPFYDEIKLLCKYKYNYDLDAFFVSRYVPTSTSMYREKLSYTYAEKIKLESSKHKVFTNADLDDGAIYRFVRSKLEQYGRYEQY